MSLLLLFNGGGSTGVNRNGRRASGGASAASGLFAVRYNGARTAILERIDSPANVGIRWALPGGLQRLELTIKAADRRDAYLRYTGHHGQYIAIYDAWCDRPIAAGWIYEVVPNNNQVTYIVEGAWKRHDDQYETDSPAAATTDSDAYLKALLTAHVPAVSSTQTYILPTGTDMGAVFTVDDLIGERPSKIVETITSFGTSASGEILDYWLVEDFISTVYPNLPLPYLVGRNSLATYAPTWHLTRSMLKDFSMATNIYNLENDTTIYYPPSTTLSANAYARDTRATIAGAAYQNITVTSAADIANEQEIIVILDSGSTHKAIVTNVVGTTITLDKPLPGQAAKLKTAAVATDTDLEVDDTTGFEDGDGLALALDNGNLHQTTVNGTPSGGFITILNAVPSGAAIGKAVMRLAATSGNVVKRGEPLKSTTAITNSTSQANYWARYHRENRDDMNSTQAAQYGNLRQSAYDSYAQKVSFSIGTRYVYSQRTKVPIWRMLINPGLIIIDDLFASDGILTTTPNNANVFRPVTLDYDHASGVMRVTPDSLDGENRIDVFMQRLGFNVGQAVARDYAFGGTNGR